MYLIFGLLACVITGSILTLGLKVVRLRESLRRLRIRLASTEKHLAFFKKSHREASTIRQSVRALNEDRRHLEVLLKEAVEENRWLKQVLDHHDLGHILVRDRESIIWDVTECPRPPEHLK